MNNQLISVIVPVYKVEQYLSKCIDSILAQTYINFELLLIDDGSPDNSGKICDECALKDSRIKVFHKENGGVSSARNLGLDNATGDWVCFVDPDDWVSEDYLYIPEQFKNADVIQRSYATYTENGNIINNYRLSKEYALTTFDSIARFYCNYRTSALWDKLIARRIIGEKRFNTDIKIGEDFLFIMSLYLDIKKYAFTNIGTYYYLIREGSALTAFSGQKVVIVSMQNIKNLYAVSSDPKIRPIQDSIVYSLYINRFYKNRKILNESQRELFHKLINNIPWRNLGYLSFKNIVKLLRVIVVMSLNL